MVDREAVSRVVGNLFETDTPHPLPIGPESWLNDPRHHDFAEAYQFAISNLDALAAKAFDGLPPEKVYLVWKTVETAFSGIQRRWVVEGFRR